jgi:hypothetical protein
MTRRKRTYRAITASTLLAAVGGREKFRAACQGLDADDVLATLEDAQRGMIAGMIAERPDLEIGEVGHAELVELARDLSAEIVYIVMANDAVVAVYGGPDAEERAHNHARRLYRPPSVWARVHEFTVRTWSDPATEYGTR